MVIYLTKIKWLRYSKVTSAAKSAASGVGGAVKSVVSKVTGSSGTKKGTVYLKPSESSQASSVAEKTGSTATVVSSSGTTSTSPSGIVTTTTYSGGGGIMSTIPQGNIQEKLQTTQQINQALAQDVGVTQPPSVISTYKPLH